MNSNIDGARLIARKNVVTTEEACAIIHRSRQQLSNLTKNGEIEPLKVTSNGNLFWRPDVFLLSEKINQERKREEHPIHGNTTRRSIEAFDNLNLDINHIDQVFVFFSYKDAICLDFYNLEQTEMPDTLTPIESARFIIIMNDGKEYWFGGLTCGYNGEGCGGTKDVLEKIGINESVPMLEDVISEHKMLHFWRHEGKWHFDGSKSVFESGVKNLYAETHIKGIEESFYRYNGHLVLTQHKQNRMTCGETQEPSSTELLLKSLYFIPDPVSVEFLTKEDAMQTGHFQTWFRDTVLYQVILRDISGRELWMEYPYEQDPPKKQQTMLEFLQFLGVDTPQETLFDRFLTWFQKKPRRIENQYFEIKSQK